MSAQRIVTGAMTDGAAHDLPHIPSEHLLEQAHVALVRQVHGDPVAIEPHVDISSFTASAPDRDSRAQPATLAARQPLEQRQPARGRDRLPQGLERRGVEPTRGTGAELELQPWRAGRVAACSREQQRETEGIRDAASDAAAAADQSAS